jgi:transglutaminase-like putative cysteine protease
MTTLKWCLKMSKPLTISIGTLVALITSLAFTPPARAGSDTAPDWLRAAAQEKLPDYDKDTNAVILLREIRTTVHENGEIETLHRGAIRILRENGRREFEFISAPFDKDTKISYMKAWTIEASGRELAVSEKDAVENGYLSDEMYDDVKVRSLRYLEANVGNVVGYEFVQRQRPYIFEDTWRFQSTLPVVTSRFQLTLPVGWVFTADWFNYPKQESQIVGSNQYFWEIKNLPALETEPEMPPGEAVEGWAGIKYYPRDPAMRSKTNGTWKDLGIWYTALTQSRRDATPEIKSKAAEVTAGLTDPIEKMRALTVYMQKNIRYYAVSIGIGGYQPHSAAEVFRHQFGDCKDKATLLSSLLSQVGVESYYVIVDTDRGVVRPDYPSMNFDHVILAIRLPEGTDGADLFATVNDPKLGRLLIFDPTNPHVPFGYLPWYLQKNYGLLIAPDGGQLISLPLLAPATNRLLRTAKFDLSPTGDLNGQVRETEWGGPAARERQEFMETIPAKRAEVFDQFLARSLNSFTLTNATIDNLEQTGQFLGVNYKFVSPGYANSAGNLLFVRPRVLGDEGVGTLRLFAEHKPRKYPIQFEEATLQDDSFDIKLPAGYEVDGLPKPVHADCEYASYKSETSVADGVLHYKRTIEIKDVSVPTEKLAELKDFLQQVAADQQASVVLKKATP